MVGQEEIRLLNSVDKWILYAEVMIYTTAFNQHVGIEPSSS